MLTPEYLDGIAAPVQEIYGQLQISIEADISRRIAKAGRVTDAASWQIDKLQELGASQQYIAEQVSKTLVKTKTEVEALFKAAGVRSLATDVEAQKAAIAAGLLPADTIPLTASAAFTQVLNANAQRTANSLQYLTRTMARDASGKLNKYMDQAQLKVQSGAFTPDQAVEDAVLQFTQEGISHFEYDKTGKLIRTRVDAAVRRALITGVNQATAQISENNAEEMGTDLVEVTSHSDSRPEHAEWQGKVYSLKGLTPGYAKLSEATGYGTGAGLCGWNCRHSFYPFIKGISEELPMEKYDPAIYEAEQKQRYNERMIREWKRREQVMEAGGVDATKAKAKVREWQQRQREHVDKHGLARMYDREKVYNAPHGRKTPSAAAERRRLAEEAEARAKTPAAPAVDTEARKAAEAAAKREAYLARKRADTAAWRARKKAEAEAVKAKAAAEAAAKAKAAADALAREAAEATAKREAHLAKKRADTAAWRARKKAEAEAAKAAAPAPVKKPSMVKKDFDDLFTTPAAKPKPVKGTIKAGSADVGKPGTYEVYRSTSKSSTADGITTYHSSTGSAGSFDVHKYHVATKDPHYTRAGTLSEARDDAYAALTGKDPRKRLPGESEFDAAARKGKEVAEAMKAKGYDTLIYDTTIDGYKVCPLAGSTADIKDMAAAVRTAPKPVPPKPVPAPKPAPKKVLKKGEKPISLEQFDTHRDSKLQVYYRSLNPADVNDALDFTAEAVEHCACRSRTSPSTMNLILQDGRFKTQFEVGSSNGAYNPSYRKQTTNKMFGSPVDKMQNTDFEYYGYLWDNDNFIDDFLDDGPGGYGRFTVQFKPEIRDRATYTVGDSLGSPMIPSYLDDQTPAWNLEWGNTTQELANASRRGVTPSIKNVLDKASDCYVEAQYHGGVTLDDVESYIFGPKDISRNGIDKSLAKALNDRGIKVGAVEADAYGDYKFRWLTRSDWA